jgi:rod shape-determining protein MreC
VDVEKQNETLRFQVAKFQGEQMKTLEVENENQRLRQLLAYKQNFPYEAIVASVIANDPRSEFKSIVIDKGASDGIVPLMPVVGPQGLVGRVGNVAAGTSRVLLITDPNSAVDVLVQRSRARGLVVGTAGKTGLRPGYYLTRIEYLRRVSDIRDGDAVVTSGFDRVFPSGIPVGSISDLVRSKHGVFLDANIVPFENMAELQDVMVLLIRVEEIPPVQGLREGN